MELLFNGKKIWAEASYYSNGCQVEAEYVQLSTIANLEKSNLENKIAVLFGEFTAEQLMPKSFTFYNPEHHLQQLIQKEITELINVPADFKNILISVNEGYEERQKISIYLFLNPDDYCEVLNKNMFEIIKLDESYEIQYNKLKNKCSKKDIPEYRKKGVGKFLVSKLCEWGINNQKINLYRHNELNKNSHFLARSLNFKEHFYVEEIANK